MMRLCSGQIAVQLTLSVSNWAVVMWAVQVQIKYLLSHSFLEVVAVVLGGKLV